MNQDPGWAKRMAADVGKRVAHFRGRTSAKQLADRCAGLGMPSLSRIVITRLENGRRETVSTAEVQVLAKALGVSPVLLLFPLGAAETVEVLPGQHADTLDAILWFTGSGDSSDVELFKAHRALTEAWPEDMEGPVPTAVRGLTAEEEQRWRQAVMVQQQLRQTRAFIRERGLTPPALSPGLEWIDDGSR